MSDINVEHVRRLDGRLLAVLHELLQTHNATLTAERLGVSQSAVSHALGRLRALHDDPLFVRRPHGLEPTRKARELGPVVERAARFAAELYGAADEFEPARSDLRFRISAPEFVTAMLAGPLLHRWTEVAPSVSIITSQLSHDEAVDAVRRGDLHLAIGRFPRAPDFDDVRRLPLYTDDYCVVARRGHPDLDDPVDTGSYLRAGHVLAGLAGEGAPGERVPRDLRVTAVVPGWLTALTVVASSDAIATCPRLLARRHAATLGLQILDVPGGAPSIEVASLTRAPVVDAPTKWLVDEIERVVADLRADRDGGPGPG